jgi:hypothetical protein
MDKLRLKIDSERLTVDMIISIDEWRSRATDGNNKISVGDVKNVRDLIASFVVDKNGDFVEMSTALKIVGGMNMTELKTSIMALVDEFRKIQEAAVPPESAAS